MDPNVTLEEIRGLCKAILEPTAQLDLNNVEQLARQIESLDNWLVMGGFPPNDWDREQQL
jgi:hypothetical protein